MLCAVEERWPEFKPPMLTEYRPLHPAEFECWRELLKRKLAKLRPNVIVACGETALRALTNVEGISHYRGSVLNSSISNTKVLAIEDNRYFHSRPNCWPVLDWDTQKLARHYKTPDLMRCEPEIIITDDLDLVAEEFLNAEFLSNPESKIATDIESCFEWLTCIGFAKNENQAFVLPFSRMTSDKLVKALRLTDQILRSPVKKILQNGNYDRGYLAYYYKIMLNNFWWDTMIAQHCLFSNLPKGLDFLCSLYTEQPYYKDEGKNWKGQHKYTREEWMEFFRYNGKDCTTLITIQEAQAELLKSRGTEHIFEQEMALLEPFLTAELQGIKMDLSRKQELKDHNDILVAKAELFLHTLVGGDEDWDTHEKFIEFAKQKAEKKSLKDPRERKLNINSSKQMPSYLYDQCKLPRRIKGGRVTTDEDALVSLLPYGNELISTIMFIREYKKKDSFYSIKVDEDNRVRTTLKAAGTETGRAASSKSFTGTGGNLQTIFKSARIMFCSDEDYILIGPDYAKAESWVVAYLAGCEKMLAALNGEDFHSTNATEILGKPVTKANYADRQLGKKVSHACWSGDAKVLTRSGWVALADLQPGVEILQHDPKTNLLSWVIPTALHSYPYTGRMVNFKGQTYSTNVTPEHRFYYIQAAGKPLRESTADELMKAKYARFPVVGRIEVHSEVYDDTDLQLAMAILADGYITKGGQVTFRLRKKRKIERLNNLLTSVPSYTKSIDTENTHCYYIPREYIESATAIIGRNKLLGPWIFNLSFRQLLLIREECLKWDGHESNDVRNRREFITTKKENAEWYQTLCHITGSQALVRKSIDKREGHKQCYRVSINNRQYSYLESMQKSESQYSGFVYCPTVPTGAFLVRYGGNVMVSGNSNYRTTPFRMQKELAKEGYDFTKTRCAELLDAYFLAYPNVRQYQERIIQELKDKDKTLVSPFGRVITFFDFWGDRLFNKACAFKPQSCVGDLTNKAIINYYYSYKERLGDIRLDFLLQVHDQIIWQCHKDDLTWEVIEFLQECMAVPITINGHTFTIPSDFELGLNWKELHEITNQQEFEEVKNKLIEEQRKLKNES
jgi:DNA polymerase I-like protein with 3'-5' exonuclease and polymerase domains